MNKPHTLLFCYTVFFLLACGPITDIRIGEDIDIYPPTFMGIKTLNSTEIEITFNEKSAIHRDNILIKPFLAIHDTLIIGNRIKVSVQNMISGQVYTLEATAVDGNENTLTFIARFYGFNPQIPVFVINEFTTR